MEKGPGSNSKFMCEFCFKKVCMLIREYGTGKWLCYECYSRKEVSRDGREALTKSNNKDV